MDAMVGKVVGRLTILHKAEKTARHGYKYLCQCECGNIKSILLHNVMSGKSKSCGNCRDNHYRVAGDGQTVIGYFADGKEFYFDLCDLEKVQRFSWYLCGFPEQVMITNKDRLTLHRYLMDSPDCEVDHINLNRFDNRRSNLRLCTHRQNQCNHGLQSNNTSGAAGVRFYGPRNKFTATIKHFGKDIHLGYYPDVVSAMQARNVAMALLFGEFARMNPVPPAPKDIETYVLGKCLPYLAEHGIEVVDE